MTRDERYEAVLSHFAHVMPNPHSELNFTNNYELIVAVILSAQCTDKRVNMVTPGLFKRWPDIKSLAAARVEDVCDAISSVSYPNSKCQYLVGMAKMVVEEFGGVIPDTMDKLTRLPGVGRKTANVMMIEAFGKPAMPVDTHVFRVAERLGLATDCKTPEQTERTLVRNIPSELLSKAHHWLVLFGRYTCTAVSPRCGDCPFISFCTLRNPQTLERDDVLF